MESLMSFEKRLSLSLFLLRLGVFVVMIMWTIDKFINTEHAARVYKAFYLYEGLSHGASYLLGGIQLLLVVGFLFGVAKRWTYGALVVLHFISTVSTWKMYLDPWGPRNLLFFAAWPMLAALLALYLLREKDVLFTWSPKK